MAGGSSGNQYKIAPIAGKMMAALIDYCENGADHDQNPLQFTPPCIQRDIDVGFYSRQRPINEASSSSVLGLNTGILEHRTEKRNRGIPKSGEL